MSLEKQSWKFIGVLAECLPELPSGFLQRWIENPLFLREFLAGLNTPPQFPTWMILKADFSIRTVNDLRKIVATSGWQVSDEGRLLLNSQHLLVWEGSPEVKFVKATVRELGFDAETHLDVVLRRIIALGHKLCAPEDGIRLMARYNDKPDLTIAMRGIKDTRGIVAVFRIGERILHAVSGHEGASFFPGDSLVFRQAGEP